MPKRLLVILLALVIAPLSALFFMGARMARDEQALMNHQLQALWMARLDDVDRSVHAVLQARAEQLDALLSKAGDDAETLRELGHDTPLVRQLFVRDAKGELSYPDPKGPLTDAEKAFLSRTELLWKGGGAFETTAEDGGGAGDSGWYTWFRDNGLHLIYWKRLEEGRVVGAEVSRVRLLSELVAELPETDENAPVEARARLRLMDARGDEVYQWGGYKPLEDEPPRLGRPLSVPLSAWRLEYFTSDAAALAQLGEGVELTRMVAFGALAIALILLAVYLHRESTRELREAAQRVTFVNRVSHELKTPLTNIRMYAELLQAHVDEDDERAHKQLAVIASESQRLSRLIGNVLTFASGRRDALRLRTEPGCLDDVVASVVEQFSPALSRHRIEVSHSRGAPALVQLDGDVIDQIMSNLISNVEKYARDGGRLDIETSQGDGVSTVRVSDAGPGIAARDAERVFQEFERLDSSVIEGVSGAGIGLPLARRLARLHGGDVRLQPGDRGATFVVTLETPAVGPGAEETS